MVLENPNLTEDERSHQTLESPADDIRSVKTYDSPRTTWRAGDGQRTFMLTGALVISWIGLAASAVLIVVALIDGYSYADRFLLGLGSALIPASLALGVLAEVGLNLSD